MDEQIVIRSLQPNDINFIYSTFLRGLYYGCEFYGEIDKKAFFNCYEQVLAKLLSKTHLKPLVACLNSDNDIILGYSLSEARPGASDVIHYVYVKDGWRRRGIANMLIGNTVEQPITHITKLGNEIRKKRNLTFNPFLI